MLAKQVGYFTSIMKHALFNFCILLIDHCLFFLVHFVFSLRYRFHKRVNGEGMIYKYRFYPYHVGGCLGQQVKIPSQQGDQLIIFYFR